MVRDREATIYRNQSCKISRVFMMWEMPVMETKDAMLAPRISFRTGYPLQTLFPWRHADRLETNIYT
jgi:hypothetical protein